MSHTVEIPDDLFSRLQQWAEPLVDNTVSLIAKLADYYEAGHSPAPPNVVSPASTAPRSAARDFSGARPPPRLTHTKVLSMQIGEAPLRKPSWNGLLFELARRAQGRVNGNDEIRRLVIVNYVSGKGDPSKGYHFIPQLGISVQGQDANYAWKGAAHLARELNIPVAAEFVWMDKPGAAHPGVIGRLTA